MEQGRVEANGVDFAYLESGPPDGPLVLCLHGFPDHAPTFGPLLADLAEAGFRAVAPWMRGYAPTTAPAGATYETAALALDAVGLADALSPGRPAFLVGHDWGAAAVWLAAGHAPERFVRVAGMGVPPPSTLASAFVTDVTQMKRSWYIFLFQTPLAELAVPANDFALLDRLWADWSPGYSPPDGFMRALKESLADPVPAISYYRAMFDPGRHDPRNAAVQAKASLPVEIPALYLHGTDDGALGVDLIDAGAVTAHFPAGIEIEIVPGAGHFLHLEQPEKVNRRLIGFLREGVQP